MNIRERVEEELTEENPEALFADGFDDAIIGYVINHHHNAVVVYDYQKCVRILIEEGLTEEDALDHLSFNTLGAYVGENTPLFVWRADIEVKTDEPLPEMMTLFGGVNGDECNALGTALTLAAKNAGHTGEDCEYQWLESVPRASCVAELVDALHELGFVITKEEA